MPRFVAKSVLENMRGVVSVIAFGVEHELLPGGQAEALREVTKKGVKDGRPGTQPSKKVGPVAWEHIEPALPFLTTPVRGLLLLLWHTDYALRRT